MTTERLLRLVGRHTHSYPVAGQHVADRLDIHPWALGRLEGAELVFFALEGTLKADSILSRIIASDAEASVFDTISVTTWPPGELRRVARAHLRGKLVVVVPDADWVANRNVIWQALMCREFLRACGVAACVAAPPVPAKMLEDANAFLHRKKYECHCKGHGRRGVVGADGLCGLCGGYFKGVDDFLAHGGGLEDLVVVEREAPDHLLALYADKDGVIRGSVWTLAPLLGVRNDAGAVLEKLRFLIEAGALKPSRELRLDIKCSGLDDWAGKAKDWPTFSVREDLRYRQRFVPLGEYQPKAVLPNRFQLFVNALPGPDRSLRDQLADAREAVQGAEGISASSVSRDARIRLLCDYLNAHRDETSRQLAALGWSTAELAEALGVTERAMRNILSQSLDVTTLRERIGALADIDGEDIACALRKARERRLPPGGLLAGLISKEGHMPATLHPNEAILEGIDRLEEHLRRALDGLDLHLAKLEAGFDPVQIAEEYLRERDENRRPEAA
jgi:hypothetical protein